VNNIKKTIGWADYSWNPMTGCSPVSEGCEHCYARALVKRFPQIHGFKGCGVPWEPVESVPIPFSTPVFHPERLGEPMKIKKPARIFVCSISDLFHEKAIVDAQSGVWDVAYCYPQHTFIILTKRPKIAYQVLQKTNYFGHGVLPNVWIGVSVENTFWANIRIHELLRIPAAKHIVSVEPMLDAINFCWWIRRVSWVIAGPETGRGARPCKDEWIDSLAHICSVAWVAFYDKRKNYIRHEWPGRYMGEYCDEKD